MIWAFGRLILIAIAVLLSLILAVFCLHMVGAQQSYTPFQHSLLTGEPLIVASGGDSTLAPPLSLSALQAAYQISPKIILGLTIRKSIDNVWVAYAADTLEELTDAQGPIQRLTADEISKLHYKNKPEERILTLEEIFTRWPEAHFFINVLHPSIADTDPLFAQLKNHKLEDHVILTSPFITTVQTLRNVDARWLTGPSTAETSKMSFMTSLYLETVIDLPGEVFIAEKYEPRLFHELSRRQKILFLVTDKPEEWMALRGDKELQNIGVLTTRPTLFAH